MSEVAALVEAGEKLGLEGEPLKRWVAEQQNEERERRMEEKERRKHDKEMRDFEREKFEAEKSLRTRELELEQKRIEIEQMKAETEYSLWKTKIRIPPFDEKIDKFDAYIDRFESVLTNMNIKKEEWSVQLSLLLTGESLQIYQNLPAEEKKVYEKVKIALLRKYELTEEAFRRKFFGTKPLDSETPAQYASRLERFFNRWVECSGITADFKSLANLIIKEQFLLRINTGLVAFIREKSIFDLDELVKQSQVYLDAHRCKLGSERVDTRSEKPIQKHEQNDEKNKVESQTVEKRACYNCGIPGHMAVDCKKPDKRGIRKCYRCGSSEHFIANCDVKDTIAALVNHGEDGLIVVKGEVNKKSVDVLLDSGCSSAVVKRSLVDPSQYTGEVKNVFLADGTKRRYPVARINVSTPFTEGVVSAVVAENPAFNLIVGRRIYENSEKKNVEVVSAMTTRAEARKKQEKEPLKTPDISFCSKEELVRQQKQQEEFEKFYEKSRSVDQSIKETKNGEVRFEVCDEVLTRVYTDKGTKTQIRQVLIPSSQRVKVMQLAHETPMSGHYGRSKTMKRVQEGAYWPGMSADVRRHVRSCHICQKTGKKIQKATMVKMPIISIPFERVAIDLIVDVLKSTEGHRYILTVVDMATRYPEAVPLKKIDTVTVAEALFSIFSRTGVPKEVLSDNGTQLISDAMKEVYRLLGVKSLTTTPYHPQTNGLCENINGQLKNILRKMCAEQPTSWHRFLPAVLFAIRSTPAKTGFTPFEMVMGRSVRGPMQILFDYYVNEEDDMEEKPVYKYVMELKGRLEETCEIARVNLEKAQEEQRLQYDKRAKPRSLREGDKVLLLLPVNKSKLLLQWKGPYKVLQKTSSVTYRIKIGSKEKVFHINMLKKYYDRKDDNSGEDVAMYSVIVQDEDDSHEIPTCTLKQSEKYTDVKISETLDDSQKREVMELLELYQDILTDLPGSTEVVEHEIVTTTETPIRDKGYPIPYAMRGVLQDEVKKMEKMGVIKRSTTGYGAPPVLVKKPDGSVRFCINYKKLNSVTVSDNEPMPDQYEIYVHLQGKKYKTIADLSKGYWQIKMSAKSMEKTSFFTPDGQWMMVRMPFGLKNSGATFNRLMRLVMHDMDNVKCYVDDIIIATVTWAEHVETIKGVLQRLRAAGLTLRPSKCLVGVESLDCLGHHVDGQFIKPRKENLQKIEEIKKPQTKKQLQRMLGVTGYYRNFIPCYSEIAKPLYLLLKKDMPNELKWSDREESAFRELKERLLTSPVLKIYDTEAEVFVQTE